MGEASQIYSMLMDYKGKVTVKIDGLAASAASVIAMAGTKVLMAPTALMMIHNPATTTSISRVISAICASSSSQAVSVCSIT